MVNRLPAEGDAARTLLFAGGPHHVVGDHPARGGGLLRARLPDWICCGAAALACLVDAFLPWMRSGSIERNGYQLLASGQHAGLLGGGGARALTFAAYLLPSLAAATLAALWVGRPAVARVLAALTGAVLAVGAVLATSRLHSGLLFGPFLGLGLGGLTVLTAVTRAFTTRSQR
ncbi:MAG TPA: hypothetical protein VFW24_00955 [Acidimicrobiales bacterium]|nr:hypothetical protein [Acidimicrobiales bacterium]